MKGRMKMYALLLSLLVSLWSGEALAFGELRPKNYYRELLDDYCRTRLYDCFNDVSYVDKTLRVDEVEEIGYLQVIVKGTMSYSDNVGRNHTGVAFKATIETEYGVVQRIVFHLQKKTDMLYESDYWVKCEKVFDKSQGATVRNTERNYRTEQDRLYEQQELAKLKAERERVYAQQELAVLKAERERMYAQQELATLKAERERQLELENKRKIQAKTSRQDLIRQYARFLESFALKYYSSCFTGRKYVDGSLVVEDIEERDNGYVVVKGKHTYVGSFGTTYSNYQFEAMVYQMGNNKTKVIFKKQKSPDLFHSNPYWGEQATMVF